MENNWKKIWENREVEIPDEVNLDQLIRINGFDSGAGKIESKDWNIYVKEVVTKIGIKDNESLYEVGCGSGAFLYAITQNLQNLKVGGIDYSCGLIKAAKKVFPNGDFVCEEASKIDVEKKYDYVLSNSVFQYFSKAAATNIIKKMMQKSNHTVCVLDIPDKFNMNEAEELRRDALSIEEYNKRYKDLAHNYYEKDWFVKIANENGYQAEIIEGLIPNYRQNHVRFGCVMQKISNF
jgi:trans-aconitate methyltransferase